LIGVGERHLTAAELILEFWGGNEQFWKKEEQFFNKSTIFKLSKPNSALYPNRFAHSQSKCPKALT